MAAARKAEANSVQTGQFWLAAAISAMKATTDTTVVGTTTAVWPSRSTSREICGATSALVSAIGRRDRAGQPVFAMRLRQHGDDADRRHGDRQAREEAGGGRSPSRPAPGRFLYMDLT